MLSLNLFLRTTFAALGALSAFATFGTFATGTGRTLYVTLGLRNEDAVRELELAGLRVDFQELDGQLVAFLDAGFLNGLEALPVDLGDMEQTILAGHDLDEAAVRHHRADNALIDLAHFGNGNNGLDLADGGVDAV